MILKEKYSGGLSQIHFWRTKERAEVDFVVQTAKDLLPVEVKFKKMKSPELNRSFRSFINRYKPGTGLIVNLNLNQIYTVDETIIRITPFWKLLTQEEF